MRALALNFAVSFVPGSVHCSSALCLFKSKMAISQYLSNSLMISKIFPAHTSWYMTSLILGPTPRDTWRHWYWARGSMTSYPVSENWGCQGAKCYSGNGETIGLKNVWPCSLLMRRYWETGAGNTSIVPWGIGVWLGMGGKFCTLLPGFIFLQIYSHSHYKSRLSLVDGQSMIIKCWCQP